VQGCVVKSLFGKVVSAPDTRVSIFTNILNLPLCRRHPVLHHPVAARLRDRALIAMLTDSFARIGAALAMRVADVRAQGAGWELRLHEKGGKQHAMPCHHAPAEALHAYIEAAGIGAHRTGMLFRTSRGRRGDVLSEQPMVRRRAVAAGIAAPIGCHTFRATEITTYLANGGTLEHAQAMAAHESPRTTKLYDRTRERLNQEEVERIRL
jgi:integrase